VRQVKRVLLVVEDGTEYTEAFRRLVPDDVTLLRAGDAEEARGYLAAHPVSAVFLDVVFDRTPAEKLAGDRARGVEHLSRNQGFYLTAELAEALPRDCRVVIAYDFAAEPARLSALRRNLPGLEGVEEGAPLSRVLERLILNRPD